jgi:hypothetical protein
MGENLSVSDKFNALVGKIISPELKKIGFRKNQNNFYRSLIDFDQIFNIQKSKWNSAEIIQFTFNIGFYNAKIHQEISDFNQPKNPKEYDCFVRLRSSSITHKKDFWYQIDTETNIGQLEKTLFRDLHEDILPLLQNVIDFKELYIFVLQNDWLEISTPALSMFIMHRMFGETEKAVAILRDLYQNAINPKDSIMTINSPDGRSETIVMKSKPLLEFIIKIEKIAERYDIKLLYPNMESA